MARAQERDAAMSRKFYFRKNVRMQESASSSVCSSPSSSSNSLSGGGRARKMMNCFPPLPVPINGIHNGPVEDEYEEMSMDEIINGKVSQSVPIY